MAKYDDLTRASHDAAILTKYGPVVSRLQLLEYEKESGVFAVWIYRGERAGRGLYHVPGAPKSKDAPVWTPPLRSAKAKKSTGRSVIPTPFDDAPDLSEEEYDRAVNGFTPTSDGTMVPVLTDAQADKLYGPVPDVFPRPVKRSAMLCPANYQHPRRPIEDHDPMAATPLRCEVCQTKMQSHWWTVAPVIDWDKFERENAPKRGRKRKIRVESDEPVEKKKRGRPKKVK
jgi:hypothetical protein